MKVIGIIQARMESTRLPNKMMLSLHGRPIIEWVVKRVQSSILLDDIIVAIPSTRANDILEKFLKKFNIKIFRGSENNVLNRFYESVKELLPSEIVRICADNPLIDGQEIDNLIQFYKKTNCDYAYNHIPKNNKYPDGLGAEIIPFKLLKWLNDNVSDAKHKEHCLSYIIDNFNRFNIKTFDPLDKKLHHPELKFDIDTFDDYYKLSMKDFDITINSKELIKLFKEGSNENFRNI